MQNKKYWQRNNPSTKESNNNEQSPQFLSKAYSFQDAMFQSFGHNEFPKKRQSKQKIDKSQEEIKSSQQNIMLPSFYQLKDQRNQQFNLKELAEKIKKIDAILKIPKNILHPCVLAINSMNKAKTETIIEINQENNDQKSKILCHNAKKYLALINIVDQQYQKFKTQQQPIEQVNNRLESRNQSGLHEANSYSKSNQTNILSKSRRRPKIEPIIKKTHQFNKSNQTQIQNLSGIGNNSNESLFVNNVSNSNSISNSNLISNFTHNKNQTNNSNEQTFKRIETPKVFQNYTNDNRQFSPTRSQSFQRYTPLKNMTKPTKIQRIQKQSTSPINKRRERSKSLNSRSPTSKIIKNSSQSKFIKVKQKQIKDVKKDEKIIQKTSNIKKINTKIRTQQIDIYSTRPKNLAFKTVDQTNQFEKMLKMASSRMKYD